MTRSCPNYSRKLTGSSKGWEIVCLASYLVLAKSHRLLALNLESTMGTLISARHLERIEAILKRRKTGTLLAGGERMLGVSSLDGTDFSRGHYFPPTVLSDVNIEDELWQEEVFGPVVVIKRFGVSWLRA